MKPKLSNSSALRIVAAAREEFSRRGFDGARMDQIARRAAVNKQLLFYYFHSKRGLFTAVLTRGAAELEQALADLPTGGERPLDRIRLALDAHFDERGASRRRRAGATGALERGGGAVGAGRRSGALMPYQLIQ